MGATAIKWLKRTLLVITVIALTLFAVRAYDSQRGPPLDLWHTYVPHELVANEIDRADWVAYLAKENALFDDVRREVTDKLPPEARTPSNRYFEGSPIYPGHFKQDWNRSYILEPASPPLGAVVLLHGLTDSPYSLRHIARLYQQRGYVVVAIRLPGHGTVPAGLSKVAWEDWSAAMRLAVREARRRIGASRPLHLIGFSNGGALAMKYALDALDDSTLSRPDRIILISPMIGITSLARFAGFFGWPAVFPPFAKAAWLGIVPEFNPFKFNSFPVNGARQSSLAARALQRQIAGHASDGRLAELPPILTFQSVVDFTVSTRAVVNALYALLPPNGSELVLFDLNRNARFGPLLRTSADNVLTRMLPDAPRAFRTTIVTNVDPGTAKVLERVIEAGATTEQSRPLGLEYPPGVFSLSHLALPFPLTDSLYGLQPGTDEDYGANLGAIAPRGERGVLIVTLDSLGRMSSNPFFDYMLERIDEGIGRDAKRTVTAGPTTPVSRSTGEAGPTAVAAH
jgi:alpha-beta hydrolase superfamily lysophospholipase